MSQASGTTTQVKFTVAEAIDGSYVTWVARGVGREVIADIGQRLVGSTCDSGPLKDAIAEHFGVERGAVTFKRKRGETGSLFVPKNGYVTVPVKPAEPEECEHRPGQPACELAGCGGTPPITTPLDRNITKISAEPQPAEMGVTTVGRDMMRALAAETGLEVTLGWSADNGWADDRRSGRKINGWEFKVGTAHVRVLTYEARHALSADPGRYAAVYVGQACAAGDINLDRRPDAWMGEIVRAVAPIVESLYDAVTVVVPPSRGWWLLKDTIVGANVETGAFGLVEVVEASTNRGMTLRVHDASGQYRFVDRNPDGWWQTSPGGAAFDGEDTWARFERRTAYRWHVTEYRHQAYGHQGRAKECDACVGEVLGTQDLATGHWWGRYVRLPWCPMCGLPASKADTATTRCPGAPRHPDDEPPVTFGEGAPVEQPAEPELRPHTCDRCNRTWPESFTPEDVDAFVALHPEWNIAPSDAAAAKASLADKAEAEPERVDAGTVYVSVANAVGEVLHEETRRAWNAGIRASEAAVRDIARRVGVTYIGEPPAREGERDTATDTYLRSWSVNKGFPHLIARVGRSAAPAPAAPPGVPWINSNIPHRFVPQPEDAPGYPTYCVAPCHGNRENPNHLHDGQAAAQPEVDRMAVAGEMFERVSQALMEGDLDTAEKMVDAGEEYMPDFQPPGYGRWRYLRDEIAERRRVRKVNPRAYTAPEPEPEPVAESALEPARPDPWGPALRALGVVGAGSR